MAYFDFERTILSYLNNLRMEFRAKPLNLGGIAGADGGTGGPVGGFTGMLPQTRVAYDTTEASTLDTPVSGASLLDNLNHIRYQIDNIVVSGATLDVQEDGVLEGTGITILNFSGASVTVVGQTATISVSGVTVLDDLTDVIITPPTTSGQTLVYNGTQWVNSSVGGTGDMLKTEYDTDNNGAVDEADGFYGTVLYRTTISGTTANFTVSGLSPIYDIITIHLMGRSSVAAVTDTVKLNLNGDNTAGNYYTQNIVAVATTITASEAAQPYIGIISGNTAVASGAGILDTTLINPFSTTYHKEAIGMSTYKNASATSLNVSDTAYVWHNTSAITDMVVSLAGGSFLAGTFILITGHRSHP